MISGPGRVALSSCDSFRMILTFRLISWQSSKQSQTDPFPSPEKSEAHGSTRCSAITLFAASGLPPGLFLNVHKIRVDSDNKR